MVCRKLEMLPIECVVRGYLTGSGWRDYQATGAVCGHVLPEGLRDSDRLPAPIFTPATKASEGHDENIDEEQAAELCGADLYRVGEGGLARAVPIRLRARRGARDHPRRHEVRARPRAGRRARARRRGADAGLVPLLARSTGTSRASRSRRSTSSSRATGASETGWDKTPPGPELPDDVVAGTRARYVEAFERLTGISFDAYLADPESRAR